MTPTVSLVVATLGRVDELAALLASLAGQEGASFEVIVVDQNGDGRLDEVLARFGQCFPLRHLVSSVQALSHARNLALPCCSGAIVGFPDDDCVYPPGLLARVVAAFAADTDLALLSGAAQSPQGTLGSGRWQFLAGPISRANVWTTSISFTLFLRRERVEALGGFDERLGVGAAYGAAEETDLVIRAVDAGAKCWYDPALRVVHPDKRLSEAACRRAYLYGAGCGFVLGKHRFARLSVAVLLARPLGGMMLALLRGRRLEAGYYARSFAGRLAGYRAASRR